MDQKCVAMGYPSLSNGFFRVIKSALSANSMASYTKGTAEGSGPLADSEHKPDWSQEC